MSQFERDPQEEAFAKLSTIANGKYDVLRKEFNVALITDVDGIKKYCFLSEKVGTRVYGNMIYERKRYVLPVSVVSNLLKGRSTEKQHLREVLREAAHCFKEVKQRGVAPVWVSIGRFGSEAPYRALCKIAEEKIAEEKTGITP